MIDSESTRLMRASDHVVLVLGQVVANRFHLVLVAALRWVVIEIGQGLEAKNQLVTSNLRMVQGVVNVYIRNGLRGQYNAGDLMQEGVMV